MVCSGSRRLKHGQFADSAPRLYDSIKKAEYLRILFKKIFCVFWMICLWTLIILYPSLFPNAPFLPSAPTRKKQENKMPEWQCPYPELNGGEDSVGLTLGSPITAQSLELQELPAHFSPHLQLQGHPWGRKGVQHFDGAPGVQSHHESLLSHGLCPC